MEDQVQHKVSIIIPHYNNYSIIDECLKSLKKISYKNIEIIVVDNNSEDNSLLLLTENHRDIIIQKSKTNLGYAGGCNLGAEIATGEYLLFLNNDTIHNEDFLDKLVEVLDNNQEIACVQPKIKNYDNKEYFDYAGASGGFIDYLVYPFCRGRIFDTIEKDYGQYNEEKEVFWTSGSCMMIRSNLFHKLNGFDKDFFAHMEEIDLCWRIKRKGFINYCIPKSVIYHVGGETLSYLNPKKTYLNFRNNLIMISKNDRFINLLYKIPSRLILDIFAAIKILINKKSISHFTSILRAYLSFITFLPVIFFKKRNNKLNYIKLKNLIIPFEYFIRGKKRFSDL